ncbi:hypothetical protein MKLM6_1590 [Methylomonas koyamae]|uniref:Uncharacterized protein n=1 Tax=Methylomonas koyamae TaxID=702114 RepID=A0A291IHQ9_9GAMM|nr:hypothetical protein MKLM6_1590 [Methylomonas koyamae]OAI21924.1 hypothetical protein A1356_20095 [Methylomonas koyamae]
MNSIDLLNHRLQFFEQLHQEFLFLTGYGTYAHINSRDVDRLYLDYLAEAQATGAELRQDNQISFIRSYSKSR